MISERGNFALCRKMSISPRVVLSRHSQACSVTYSCRDRLRFAVIRIFISAVVEPNRSKKQKRGLQYNIQALLYQGARHITFSEFPSAATASV